MATLKCTPNNVLLSRNNSQRFATQQLWSSHDILVTYITMSSIRDYDPHLIEEASFAFNINKFIISHPAHTPSVIGSKDPRSFCIVINF